MTFNSLLIIFLNRLSRLFPDALYLKIYYYLILRKKLHLSNPKSFNEKINWLKIYDRKQIYSDMVDKAKAKEYVASIIGKDYIIPTLGEWSNPDQINWDDLPNQFVLKCTHDSGGLVICHDKNKLNKKTAIKKISKCLMRNYYWSGREWPYKHVEKKIIAEKFMTQEDGSGLRDYKFYCFNGEPKFLYISEGMENHSTAKISFLTLDWKFAPFHRSDYAPFSILPDKPSEFDEMVEIAKKLSQNIPFLRVDLYQINERIYFSELTFSPCSGMMPFMPIDWDRKIGDYLKLPNPCVN